MTLLSLVHNDFPRSSLLVRPRSSDRIMDSFIRDIFDENWDISQPDYKAFQKVKPLALDVKETETQYEVLVDAPGVDKESTKIEIKDHYLTITTERKATEVTDTDKVKRTERYFGTSMRSLPLGEDVDEDKVDASYNNGMLHIKLAKKAPEDLAKRVKTIEIY